MGIKHYCEWGPIGIQESAYRELEWMCSTVNKKVNLSLFAILKH